MEFYQRVKQKLADELEAESPLEYPEGKISNMNNYIFMKFYVLITNTYVLDTCDPL